MQVQKEKFFLAVNTGMTDGDNLINQKFIEFYEARASEKLYCAIVGNVVIPNGFGTNERSPNLTSDKIWKELASRIENKGSIPGIQLASTWMGYKGQYSFISKLDNVSLYKGYASEFNENFILEQFQNLKQGTELAIEHGFRHIQLHAAHGYLFNLLIEPFFTVHYGLVLSCINDWLLLLKKHHIDSSIRISLITGDPCLDEILNIKSFIQSVKPDFYDLSDGFYNINKRLIYPYSKNIEERIARQIAVANQFPEQNFISSGLSYGYMMHEKNPNNLHIGICRDLIASPNFLFSDKVRCNSCSKCHYYSRARQELECPQWNIPSSEL
ncbi:oxidoreductase [Alkanindiges hydrocarboniclasticus]|jgi:hypothetical protein|nr:hypothetical protein [Alkanindiges hydrocarboniclasticus]